MIDNAKKQYFSERFVEARSIPRDVFKLIDTLMHRNTPSILPSHDTFAEIFFTHKITKIRSDLSLARDHNLNRLHRMKMTSPPACRNSSLPQKLTSGS
ncbi:hypothetical protein LSAT2_020342 [Lamellibrachia satsuma]|nr:hypothetical protein LSAT2_020342 [Lamellibrachia satsuma]